MLYFSIIIPLFNKQNQIENTIKSVLNQTYTYYEIIVINDGSTDESVSKVLEFKDSRIQVYNQKNQGAAVARNLGIEKAKHDYIAFLDADDLWMENHLETLNTLILNFPDCGIYCSRYKIKTSKNHFQIPHYNGVENSYIGIVENYFFSNRPFRITWTSSLVIPKEILSKNGGFTSGVTNGEDLELWTKVGINNQVAITNLITAIYNFDIPNSLAKKDINSMKLMDFEQFKTAEEKNPHLKKFLDLYRIEYALQYKIAGTKTISMQLYSDIDKKNIKLKSKIVFQLPRKILLILLQLKQYLRIKGIDFSIYQ